MSRHGNWLVGYQPREVKRIVDVSNSCVSETMEE